MMKKQPFKESFSEKPQKEVLLNLYAVLLV